MPDSIFFDALMAALPIAFLIYLMVKPKNMPAHIAMPLTAAVMLLLKWLYFDTGGRELGATVIDGFLTAWTPILVIGGAILLFKTLENTGAMDTIRAWLNSITTNSIGQLMIIGWAFSFLIEGASGFGTPAALAAPLLVGLGFPAVRVAILTLIMNSVPVTFGAVGTPVWFGLGQIGLSGADLQIIAFKAAVMHSVAALIIPLIALKLLVEWKEIRRNLVFVYLSILSCVIPYVWLALINYEFPALVGGAIGLIFTIAFARYGVGLEVKKLPKTNLKPLALLKASFPLWGTVLLLVITRLKPLGLNTWLQHKMPSLDLVMDPLGTLSISSALVVQLKNILGTGITWAHALLYVPSILPFLAVALLTFWLYKSPKKIIRKSFGESWQRMKKPIIALIGALVLVKLILTGGPNSLATLMGTSLAELTGNYWIFFAPYLGALGAFFAGSNTVSNLTFGGIQLSIAQSLGLDTTTILALQTVGGAMGNMVCINNIVAVCSVLGLEKVEGAILKKTVLPMVLYGVVAIGVGLALM